MIEGLVGGVGGRNQASEHLCVSDAVPLHVELAGLFRLQLCNGPLQGFLVGNIPGGQSGNEKMRGSEGERERGREGGRRGEGKREEKTEEKREGGRGKEKFSSCQDSPVARLRLRDSGACFGAPFKFGTRSVPAATLCPPPDICSRGLYLGERHCDDVPCWAHCSPELVQDAQRHFLEGLLPPLHGNHRHPVRATYQHSQPTRLGNAGKSHHQRACHARGRSPSDNHSRLCLAWERGKSVCSQWQPRLPLLLREKMAHMHCPAIRAAPPGSSEDMMRSACTML